MIRYAKGNLLDADAEALVNTVNEVGVMGKGIALAFKDSFPENTASYAAACRRGEVNVGRMFVTRTNALMGPKWIINFPTKKHWRHPSKLEWVKTGLTDLARVIRENGIRSVALPPLGCGNGGLDWPLVRREIEAALGAAADVEVVVYPPSGEYRTEAKASGVVTLTPARAMMVEAIRQYLVLGFDCSILEVQKLGWFLTRAVRWTGLSDPFQLKFEANIYGPYADNLRHLLDSLDGSYLHCRKRIADADPLEPIDLDPARLDEISAFLQTDAVASYKSALDATSTLIDGFQSPLGMELLATVDWLIERAGCSATVADIRVGLGNWPKGQRAAARKLRLFDDRLVGLALSRLTTTLHD